MAYQPVFDPTKTLAGLTQAASTLMRASRGAVGAGAGAGGVAMQTYAVPDPTSPTGYREITAPKGTTAKEREQIAAAQQQYAATAALQSDPVIAGKLAKLSTVPVSERSKILDDIRQNDIGRLQQATGLRSSELFNAMMEPVQAEVAAQTREIKSAGGFWKSLAIGTTSVADQLAATLLGDTAEQRVIRAKEHQAYVQKATEENAYLRERAAQTAAGMGFFERAFSPTGSVMGEIGAAAGEMLPGAAAIIGGGTAGARIGALAGPAGALAGSIIGAGLSMAAMAPQAATERIVADPRLTEAEKIEATRQAIAPAAAVGFAEGGVGAAFPAVAGVAGRALMGTRAAAPGMLGRLMAPIAETPSMLGRYAKSTAMTASELSAMNLVGVPGQNIVYESVTGQPVSTTEGLAETLQHSMLAAPFFGLARVGRGPARTPRPAAEPAKPGETAPPAVAGVAPTEAVGARFAVGQARRTLIERLNKGEVIDPATYVKGLSDQGWTPEQFKALFDQPGVDKKFRLDTKVANDLRTAYERMTAPPVAPELEGITALRNTLQDVTRDITAKKDVPEASITALIDRYLETPGASLDAVEQLLADIPLKGKGRIHNHTRSILENKIAAERQAAPPTVVAPPAEPAPPVEVTPTLEPAPRAEVAPQQEIVNTIQEVVDGTITPREADARLQTTQLGPEGGGLPEAPVVGPVGVVGEARVTLEDIFRDSGVTFDTPAVPPAAPPVSVAEPVVSDRAVKGRRAGRAAKQNIRPVETVDGITQAAGTEPGIGSDPRPSVVPPAPADAAAGPRPGEPTSPAVGTNSRAGATETTRPVEVVPPTDGLAQMALDATVSDIKRTIQSYVKIKRNPTNALTDRMRSQFMSPAWQGTHEQMQAAIDRGVFTEVERPYVQAALDAIPRVKPKAPTFEEAFPRQIEELRKELAAGEEHYKDMERRVAEGQQIARAGFTNEQALADTRIALDELRAEIAAKEGRLTPEVEARVLEDLGLTKDVEAIGRSLEMPGETLVPTEVSLRSPEAMSARIAELPRKELEQRFGTKVEGYAGPVDRAMDLLFKEAFDPKRMTTREKQDLRFLRGQGIEKMEVPQAVVEAFVTAKLTGMKAEPMELARALNESVDTYKKVIDRWSCGA